MDQDLLADRRHRRDRPRPGRRSRDPIERAHDRVPGRSDEGDVPDHRARVPARRRPHQGAPEEGREPDRARAPARARRWQHVSQAGPLLHRQPADRSTDRDDSGPGPLPEPRCHPAAGPLREGSRADGDRSRRENGAAARGAGDPGRVPGRGGGSGRQGRSPDGDPRRAGGRVLIHREGPRARRARGNGGTEEGDGGDRRAPQGGGSGRCRGRPAGAGVAAMSRFFIDHPIVAQVLAILTMIGGAVMIFRLPIAQFPEIAPRQIQTTATYTGADALTVEQSVATPIDEQVNGANVMIYMQAISANDGTMTFQVSFDVDSDIDMDQVQVQNRLAQAQANLPAAVNAYGFTTIQTAGFPLLVFTMTSPNHTWDQTFLSNYLAINVQDELSRLPGIGQTRIFGASNYAMRVWVSPATIANMGLTVTDLVNAIAGQNVVNPAGQIGGEPAPPGQQLTYTVRARGRLMNAEEFGDIVVRANADGSFVRLKDVARLELGGEDCNMQRHPKGAPARLWARGRGPGPNA